MVEVKVRFKSRGRIPHNKMLIGELASRSGLTASAIRYYEKAGLLDAATRESGRRVYDATALRELLLIQFAKATGFTLRETKLLLRGFPAGTPPSRRWKKMATAKLTELERTVARARAMKRMLESVLSCRCQTLSECAQKLGKTSRKMTAAPSHGLTKVNHRRARVETGK